MADTYPRLDWQTRLDIWATKAKENNERLDGLIVRRERKSDGVRRIAVVLRNFTREAVTDGK